MLEQRSFGNITQRLKTSGSKLNWMEFSQGNASFRKQCNDIGHCCWQ